MISNEVSRDERVHLSENDIIVNELNDGLTACNDERVWPQTRSDAILQEVHGTEKQKTIWKKIQGAIFPMIVLGVILGLVIMLFVINNSPQQPDPEPIIIPYSCQTPCSISLVESIPENLTYPAGSPHHISTYSVWKRLISEANETLNIAALYMTLRWQDTSPSETKYYPSSEQGGEIFLLIKDAIKRGVNVRIVQDGESGKNTEINLLSKAGADVRTVNVTKLLGAGVIHTKFIIADRVSFYSGSANMDWRSLTQVKEMGTFVDRCQCPIVDDMEKVFELYWKLGAVNATIPDKWPDSLDTNYNRTHPLKLYMDDNSTAEVFISASSPPMITQHRTADDKAILDIMEDAREYIYIAVMDYFPTTLYMKKNKFWPLFDDKLKQMAFEKKIKVKLLASYWNHTDRDMIGYLKSLYSFSYEIDVKLFCVPSYGNQSDIPFARVNHNKYMVTDRIAYIGTSNWSGDYFLSTAGVGVVYNQTESSTNDIRSQLEKVFNRDWHSEYSNDVTTFDTFTSCTSQV